MSSKNRFVPKQLVRNKPRRDEAFALAAGINAWVEDNLTLATVAQRAAARATMQGLVDVNVHNPFQIVPTDVVGVGGNWVHQIFLNIDHAAHGYYRVNVLTPTKFEIIPPSIISDPYFMEGEDAEIRLHEFIDNLANSLNVLYEIQDGIDGYNEEKINQTLEKLVAEYREAIDPALKSIKSLIDTTPGAAISDPNLKQIRLASKLDMRYDLALQHPRNWMVFDNIDDSSEEPQDSDSKNETLTLVLQDELMKFWRLEASKASYLYMAQKLLMTNRYKVQVVTDSAEDEPDATNYVQINPRDLFVFVRPVMHCTAIITSEGPSKPKPSKKNGWGAQVLVH